MKNFNSHDTIAAISTPIGKGGIGIVRLSGPNAFKIADKIFQSSDKKRVEEYKSFTMHYGKIVEKDEGSQVESQVVDEVLLSVMKSPKTYTTEDMIEINCHSGIAVLKKILDLVLMHGARLADPGEFTQRAFINGRIDLAQAEAVLDMVDSKTEDSAQVAVQQLEGELSSVINDLRERLVNLHARIEAFLDFPEEEETELEYKNIKSEIKEINKDMGNLIEEAEKGELLREGRSLVICGRPNVGKSCLMNALLRKDRVIVTPVPGTTRDIIEESISIQGISFRIIDTAGMISSNDIVEMAGVERSKKHLETSDLVLLLIDSSEELREKDKELIKSVNDKPHIIVLNKVDLSTSITAEDIEEYKEKNSLGKENCIVKISALKEKGIEKLEKAIIDMVWEGKIKEKENILITNCRHKQSLIKAHEDLRRINKLPEKVSSVELMSIDLKFAIDKLGEITGETYTEDLLDRIFSQFCIGK